MKKIGWIIIIIVAICAFIIGITGSGEKFIKGQSSRMQDGIFINDTYKFRFTIPVGWQYKELKDNKQWKLICNKNFPLNQGTSAEKVRRGLPGIYFNFEDANYSTLEKITDTFITTNRSQVPQFNILSQTDRHVIGINAKELVYTGNLSHQGVAIGTIKAKQLFIVKDNIFYNFLFMDLLTEYDKNIEEFDNLVNSLIF